MRMAFLCICDSSPLKPHVVASASLLVPFLASVGVIDEIKGALIFSSDVAVVSLQFQCINQNGQLFRNDDLQKKEEM